MPRKMAVKSNPLAGNLGNGEQYAIHLDIATACKYERYEVS